MDPVSMAIMASAAVGSSVLGGQSQARAQKKANKPYMRNQEKKNALIDELISSVSGKGRFSDLFAADESAFQKSFVDPAKSMFKNQIAPQIQQQSIAGGMQRSSSIENQLARAGVDLDQMLNQNYAQFQGQAQNRGLSALQSILGSTTGAPVTAPQTTGSMLGGAGAALFSDPTFQKGAGSLYGSMFPGKEQQTPTYTQEQRDILNPPSSMNQDASLSFNKPRPGFALPPGQARV